MDTLTTMTTQRTSEHADCECAREVTLLMEVTPHEKNKAQRKHRVRSTMRAAPVWAGKQQNEEEKGTGDGAEPRGAARLWYFYTLRDLCGDLCSSLARSLCENLLTCLSQEFWVELMFTTPTTQITRAETLLPGAAPLVWTRGDLRQQTSCGNRPWIRLPTRPMRFTAVNGSFEAFQRCRLIRKGTEARLNENCH